MLEEQSGNSNENRKFTTVTPSTLLLRVFAFRLLGILSSLADICVPRNGNSFSQHLGATVALVNGHQATKLDATLDKRICTLINDLNPDRD